MENERNQKLAFTLAEVLITLGIIGVVAALTIPTLVANYQAKSWATAKSVFEGRYVEALKIMNSQGVLAGYPTTEKFIDGLSKYLKIANVCTNPTDCFSENILWNDKELDLTSLKTSKNFGWKDWKETNAVGVQFADGVSAILAYNKDCKQNPFSNDVDVTNCTAILYDTSANKNPNENGKDINSFNIHRLLDAGCVKTTGDICITTLGFKPKTGLSKAECEQLIQEGYGIKECGVDNDYWAAAVKECGGVNHLPSVAQLKTIGADIYPDGVFNEEISLSYGFQSATGGNLLIYSGVETSAEKATGMISYGAGWGRYTYRINHWGGGGYVRNGGAGTAICVD